jgi:PEP-CTERM motif
MLLRVLIAVLVVSLPAAARSATIVGPLDGATGINDLIVDGQAYDVTFLTDVSYAAAFPTPPVFMNNSGGAFDAAVAIASELNAAQVTLLTGPTLTQGGGGANAYFVPYQFPSALGPLYATSIAGGLHGNNTLPWFVNGNGQVYFNSAGSVGDAWAAMTPMSAAAPEPATAWLLLLGLGGLGVFARRRRIA